MKKYLVTYKETYTKIYEIEANSKEEAKKILENDIFEGRVDGPDECCSSSYKIENPENEIDL